MTSPSPAAASPSESALSSVGLFAFVVLAWSLNWVVMKLAVQEIAPLWAVTIRTGLAALILFPALAATGQLSRPPRSDLPILLVIALFHMVAFAALMTIGLTLVPASRAIVLGYTTPLWVAPASLIFLGERVSVRQAFGIVIGVGGLLLLFKPGNLDWSSSAALAGNALVLLAALCWAVSIVYTRGHRWVTTPLRLMPWQCLLATAVLAPLALFLEGPPPTRMGPAALSALAYNGVIGTALGFWAMTVVNRRVPATTASLGVLVTPVLGIAFSNLFLGERLDPILILSAATIMFGITVGVVGKR